MMGRQKNEIVILEIYLSKKNLFIYSGSKNKMDINESLQLFQKIILSPLIWVMIFHYLSPITLQKLIIYTSLYSMQPIQSKLTTKYWRSN